MSNQEPVKVSLDSAGIGHIPESEITRHYNSVKEFMSFTGQEMHDEITIPSAETRILRAKLILEEAFETIHAMGVKVMDIYDEEYQNTPDDFDYVATDDVNLIEVADGCADVMVVTTGTLIAFGIKDAKLLQEVNNSNLAKRSGYRSDGTDGNPEGKWIKPKNWQKPDIAKAIGYNE